MIRYKAFDPSKKDWEWYYTGYRIKRGCSGGKVDEPEERLTFLGWLVRILLIGIPTIIVCMGI